MYRPTTKSSTGLQLIASKKAGLEIKKKNVGRYHRRSKKRKYILLNIWKRSKCFETSYK